MFRGAALKAASKLFIFDWALVVRSRVVSLDEDPEDPNEMGGLFAYLTVVLSRFLAAAAFPERLSKLSMVIQGQSGFLRKTGGGRLLIE